MNMFFNSYLRRLVVTSEYGLTRTRRCSISLRLPEILC